MDRVEARTRAQRLLEDLYMTERGPEERETGTDQLAELARTAEAGGAPLAEHREGPWRSDRCRLAHTRGRADGSEEGALTCIMRGEFELPLSPRSASDVAALLNWADVPEPGAQT